MQSRMIIWRLVFVSAVFMTMSVAAAAGDKEDCFDFGHVSEVNIRACTGVIESGSLSDQELARVLNRRAFMRCLAGDFDGAADDAIDAAFYAEPFSFEREEALDMFQGMVFEECHGT